MLQKYYSILCLCLFYCSCTPKLSLISDHNNSCVNKSDDHQTLSLKMYDHDIYKFQLPTTDNYFPNLPSTWVDSYNNPYKEAMALAPSFIQLDSYLAFLDCHRVVLYLPDENINTPVLDLTINTKESNSFQKGYYFIDKASNFITIEFNDSHKKKKQTFTFRMVQQPIVSAARINSLAPVKTSKEEGILGLELNSIVIQKNRGITTVYSQNNCTPNPIYYATQQEQLKLFWEEDGQKTPIKEASNLVFTW